MYLNEVTPQQDALRHEITQHYHNDEASYIGQLLTLLDFNESLESDIKRSAESLVVEVRKKEASKKGIEALMVHYDLSTQEGIMLMCLAEALLRIPDKETEHLLIRDKLTSAQWNEHLGQAESSFVNMATWGLALTGKILNKNEKSNSFSQMWKGLVRRSSEPVVRKMVREAIKIMSEQFVLGRHIDEALKRSKPGLEKGYSYSYDMLGEAARTMKDADVYMESYNSAIDGIGTSVNKDLPLFKRPSISVKLSAIYPRYDFLHQKSAKQVLIKRLMTLSLNAKKHGICLTVDAEEADRLDISLDIIEAVFCDPQLKDWDGLGLAVQAYQKRALSVLHWLADLGRKQGKHMRVRLVKGAYWDSEIKHAQELGYKNYPVFTRKIATDVSYLTCAKELLNNMQDAIYPQFATHNAYTVAAILSMLDLSDSKFEYEFQSLHGMGDSLHDQLIAQKIPCRVYAPVGSHEDLLPYLVRRLLENGANSSFVNQIADKNIPIEELTASPVKELVEISPKANPKIPLPRDIFGEERSNSDGIDYTDYDELRCLQAGMESFWNKQYQAAPWSRKITKNEESHSITNPANRDETIGQVVLAEKDDVEQALQQGVAAFKLWDCVPIDDRAEILHKVADLLEKNQYELMTLTLREAGKVLTDCIAEIREAVDFCRYYAELAKTSLAPQELVGYTGETNTLRMRGRGLMLCISPWNFPVAIFTGQIAAALVAGNTVVAKPAEQTSLIAARVIELFYEAGAPKEVLQLMPAKGETIGKHMVQDERIAGVLFTGSTATAKIIQMDLARRQGPIVPFIAETGGINALIADSTALPEQLIDDVVVSAFGSAGQRCSALRVLFVQDDIADNVIEMLQGALKLLVVGDPRNMRTDVGPVIDNDAQKMLNDHIKKMRDEATLIGNAKLCPDVSEHSTYAIPHAFELTSLSQLKQEVFGPVLHVIRYARKNLDSVIDEINGLGFGLTFGIQSRIDESVEYIQSRMRVGNIYVNRNIIGAMVGVQPFGGSGLSGTGPKAGGPHYLLRLCQESTLTINTTAAGGNASLMSDA
jgi:RHH-type proline utilization regulon transcriptional repressor/proline dehydrogenase/delta 1-pyrroline-5-carboxylate dehydrogenase